MILRGIVNSSYQWFTQSWLHLCGGPDGGRTRVQNAYLFIVTYALDCFLSYLVMHQGTINFTHQVLAQLKSLFLFKDPG